jgi:hypothetical protein
MPDGPNPAQPGRPQPAIRSLAPATGDFVSLQPPDADCAAQVCRELDSLVTSSVTLRLEPEHGPISKRPNR